MEVRRLPAIRRGPYWFVCSATFRDFRRRYEPAPSAGRKLGPRSGDPAMTEVVAGLLDDWGEARVDELSTVVGRAEGNVRKYLALLVAQGRAFKTGTRRGHPRFSPPWAIPERGSLNTHDETGAVRRQTRTAWRLTRCDKLATRHRLRSPAGRLLRTAGLSTGEVDPRSQEASTGGWARRGPKGLRAERRAGRRWTRMR